MIDCFARIAALLGLAVALSAPATPALAASRIERIVTPAGIVAWLVRETSVPVVAVSFSFRGGANADPADKPGVGNMFASLLDEGAGDLDSRAFHGIMERQAIELSFTASRDRLRGALRTLGENRDQAFELLRLALTAPRFDTEPVERIRTQVLSGLRRSTTSPADIANRNWWQTAFPGHPYGKPSNGTLESVPTIAVEDLRTYGGHVLSRGTLTIGIVGDLDAATAGRLIDHAFAGLPARTELPAVEPMSMQGLGRRVVIDLDVPQTTISFGRPSLQRKDPDFFAAYVVNHILGGGSHFSRLYREVREARGLAYSVSTGLYWLDYTAILTGGTATRAERAPEALALMEREIRRMAEEGPTQEELDKAKAYLKGSYALSFDTSSKIAAQLMQIQLDELGIDYVERRAGLIDAVTLVDAKRVAKRLLEGGLLVTVVGRSQPFKGE